MRAIVLLLSFGFFQNAVALPGARRQQEPTPPRFTQVIEHMSNSSIEELVALSDEVTSQPDIGNCEHFVYRVKMQLPQGIGYDAALNEFVSMISPGERTFVFGLLSHQGPGSIAKLASANMSDESKARLQRLGDGVEKILSTNSQSDLMGGIAVYSKADKLDVEMKVRAVLDIEANEFLMFGSSRCQ